MPKPQGSTNKISAEVKEQLQNLIYCLYKRVRQYEVLLFIIPIYILIKKICLTKMPYSSKSTTYFDFEKNNCNPTTYAYQRENNKQRISFFHKN